MSELIALFHTVTNALAEVAITIGDTRISLFDVLAGIVMLSAVFWVTTRLLDRLERRLRKSSLSYNVRELTIKLTNVLVYFIAIVIALSAVGIDLTAFAVFGGALGVGLGLGLQRITANFVSGITLLLEKSIKIGDHIQIGADLTGVVKAMNIRYTLIETPKGTDIIVPNETLTTTNVINFTYTNMSGRGEITLTVDYHAPLPRALAILTEVAAAHSKVLKTPAPSAFARNFRDNGVECVLFFWIADIADGLMRPQSEMMQAIAERFAQEDIHLAHGPSAKV